MRARPARISPQWRGRLLGGVALAAVGFGAAALFDFGPRPVPYALWSLIALATAWLVLDSANVPLTSWRSGLPPPSDRVDQASSDLRILTGHRQASQPSEALRERLVALARARDPDLAEALRLELDPVRRLSPADVDRILTRIEEIRD
ncbi:hypothetical protein [Nocardioides okcheonensis]|uniref:hypothetical protein n=1 Tax=Nocardioides okcheonensis TaxID=2894081 RepID=UPI001E357C95|nr:hypothetical protein [Nocardioides okcheonensis]UFN44146.1 hypothetical protein LN652_19180 [Nocardioides okcheonensis]